MKPNILMTPQFKQAFKLLKKKHQNNILKDIIKVIEQLVNFEITTQKSNHPLSDGINDLHIRGDVILLYRYQGAGLIIDLNLLNISDHKELQKNLKLAKKDTANIPFDLENEKKNLREESFEPLSQEQILKRGDLSEYKISDKELEEVRNRDIVINNLKENLIKSEIQEIVNDIVDRMNSNLKDADNKTTDIEFEISTTNKKEISKIFSLLNDMCSDKYIDYEIEDEQTYPEGKYYYATLSRKYPDDYYFDYEDDETTWVTQPGQRTGKYKNRKNENMNLKEELSLSELVKDSINHLVNDLGRDSDAEDFADDVINDIENNYDVDVDFSDPLKYKNWASEVACEVSRQLNEALHGNKEINEFFKICRQLGLNTLGDLADFADNNKSRIEINKILAEEDSSMSADAFFETLRDYKREFLEPDPEDDLNDDGFDYDDPLHVVKKLKRKDESMETKLNKQEVLDWLSEHDLAWEDFMNYFEDIYLKAEDVPMDELLGWISEHDDLAEEFENKFGISVNADVYDDFSEQELEERLAIDKYDQIKLKNIIESKYNIESEQDKTYKAIIVNSSLVDFCGRDYDKPVVEDTITPINIVANSDEEAAKILLSKIYDEQPDDSDAIDELNNRYSYSIAFEDFGQLDIGGDLTAVLSLKTPSNVELITRTDLQVADAKDALKQYKKYVREIGEYVKYQKISLADEISLNKSGVLESISSEVKENVKSKWNIGSNKLVSTDSQEYANLVDLAKLLQERSPNGYEYRVEKTYEDFGAGMQWYTIICDEKNGWGAHQVLNTKQWLDLANTGDIESVYQDVVSDKYFQDKSDKTTTSMFNYMDSLED